MGINITDLKSFNVTANAGLNPCSHFVYCFWYMHKLTSQVPLFLHVYRRNVMS